MAGSQQQDSEGGVKDEGKEKSKPLSTIQFSWDRIHTHSRT